MTTDSTQTRGISRRNLLKVGAGAGAVAAAGSAFSPWEALTANAQAGRTTRRAASTDYGALVPVKDETTGLELIALPRGFEYITYGWTGDEMSDGRPTPSNHDGMAAFRARRGNVSIVRNHEKGAGTAFISDPAYNALAGGGTTNMLFDPRRGQWLEDYASLSGTIRNCAGGPTPWNSWITCEETTILVDGVKHGYVFDVPSDGKGDAVPLKEAGRFSHEAVAVDPRSGILYLTEDATPSGLYRYIAPRPGRGRDRNGKLVDIDIRSGLDVNIKLDDVFDDFDDDRDGRKERTFAPGGVLQMLAIGDSSYQTYTDDTGTEYADLSWVTIENPDWDPGELPCVQQGIAKGGAQFSRLEGCWFGNDRIYIIATNGGPARKGQVFEYDPRRERMRVLYASPNEGVLDSPDNVTVSPRGGLVLCEDGGGDDSFVHGLTQDGEIFRFAENRVVIPSGGVPGKPSIEPGSYTDSEWAGACFDPSGKWMFVVIQNPGITFAITGPWGKGGL